MAFAGAVAENNGEVEGLYNRGVRVAKPGLVLSSFLDRESSNNIEISLNFLNEYSEEKLIKYLIYPRDISDIYSRWHKEQSGLHLNDILKEAIIKNEQFGNSTVAVYTPLIVSEFIIYGLNIHALRGISNESRKTPLGINGEGLDVLISIFDYEEMEKLRSFLKYNSWLQDIIIDKWDERKYQGHKLGKSTSTLYFVDKFMQKNNNEFSAENANEGVLHILFYLALFISKKTPAFFGIDNIEQALNPQLCRTIIKELAILAADPANPKQALITTHNPAVLDGMNLHDENQRLFRVYRNDEGETQVERIKIKPGADLQKYKLSELWMRGHLGAIPTNF